MIKRREQSLCTVSGDRTAPTPSLLQTALFEPFEILRHSNRESRRKKTRTAGQDGIREFGSSGGLEPTTLRLTVAAAGFTVLLRMTVDA